MTRANNNELLWLPLPGPQQRAYLTEADELYYGGAAGGGKSDFLLGLAVNEHRSSIIFRREFTQLTGAEGLIERSKEILSPTNANYNGQEKVWRNIPGGRKLEFGAIQYDDDKKKYQGRPHDLIGFDEVANFLKSQYEFVIGWNRTTIGGQRCRIVACGNPPTTAEGSWIIDRWAPWLDLNYSNPALPGELRWFVMIDNEDTEVDGPDIIRHRGEKLIPKSRTFIPAKLEDNPYLMNTNYKSILQGLPEPLRSQLLFGDHTIGLEDDPFQVIPTDWVRQAQERWLPERPDTLLTSMGVDPARGGKDETVIAKRYDNYIDNLIKYPGKSTPNGPIVAAQVEEHLERKDAPINVDVIGIGSSVFDCLEDNYNASGINVAEKSRATDKTGRLKFANLRAELWWKMRERLDPELGDNIALPNDRKLLEDLCAPHWKLSVSGIAVESKDDIKKRLGRSPDSADAVCLAFHDTFGNWGSLISTGKVR